MASFHLIQNSINFQVRNYKVPGNIKHLINFRKVPKINFETEVKETIGRGSGPGGTNVNKANNAVRLVHLETKIQVKNHESRSVEKNREFARYLYKIGIFLYSKDFINIYEKQNTPHSRSFIF